MTCRSVQKYKEAMLQKCFHCYWDCAIITWRGGWETRRGGGGDIGENHNYSVRRGSMKRGGHYLLHSFPQTGKVVEEPLEFKYLYLLTLELN